MTIESLNINFFTVLPELLLSILALAVLVLDLLLRKRPKTALGFLSIAGLVVILPLLMLTADSTPSFGAMVISDNFSVYFNFIFITGAILTLLISTDYLTKLDMLKGEYYYLVLFATLGMMVMASANDLLGLYVGLELMALSFYVLVAIRDDSGRPVEGALKYFILGALSSGILLYGISFTYGFGGTTNLTAIAQQASQAYPRNPYLLLAIALVAVGFGFKMALFPFHLWAPDAYESAPVPVTALLSVGSKAAAFAVFLRVFMVAFSDFQPQWSNLMWILSAATMVFGSVVAIAQKNIVRMMAYSSIAHAGIIIIGLLVYNQTGISGILYYLLVYTFMNMGVFAVIALLAGKDRSGDNICDFKGLASYHPMFAFLMALFLLALAGVPPTAGFTAKFFILAAAIDAHYYWLAAIGVAATAVALFFYAKVIFYMYMVEPEAPFETVRVGLAGKIALFITAAGTMIPGLYPAPFVDLAVKVIKPFLA